MDHKPSIVETTPLGLPGAGSLAVAPWQWPDEAATQAFAQALARCPALGQAFITLHGDLGAGKTTFTRHLLQALGVSGRIKSPTYTIVEAYERPGLAMWHFDFYRFNDPQEWEDAGFRDIFASPGLKLAEWPQKAQGLLPPPDLDLRIHASDDGQRQVQATAYSGCGLALLRALPGPAEGRA